MCLPAAPWRLMRAGVLGINRRNAELCLPLNPRHRYPLVDDKVLTKSLCREHGIPVPETFAIVDRIRLVRDLDRLVANRPEFVVKPARGAGGRGILIITDHDGRTFTRSTGDRLSLTDLRHHIWSILGGLHSLSGRPDRVIIEARVRPHPAFERLSVGGTPDVRVIVHRGQPLMAMMRLPTSASGGRANLHQGGVGAGIELATGRTFHAVCRNRPIDRHPDTDAALCGVQVPDWALHLDTAARSAQILDLGYVGIDLALDPLLGPVVLEANGRPGLSIQMANRRGILAALREREAQKAADAERELPFSGTGAPAGGESA